MQVQGRWTGGQGWEEEEGRGSCFTRDEGPAPFPAAPRSLETHLNSLAVALLLLKRGESLVNLLRCAAWQVVERKAEDGARALGLAHVLLKLGKPDVELLLREGWKREGCWR